MKVPWISGRAGRKRQNDEAQPSLFDGVLVTNGEPLLLPVDRIEPDPHHPRREGDETELDELAADIAIRGVLQPIVVAPADAQGRHRLWFGGRRLNASVRSGLSVVPVIITSAAHDGYAQVAENLKRASLLPMDLARFVQGRVEAGESNATIATKLGIDETTVAHYLTLLSLPPVLEAALRSGRCASPKTLHELARLHQEAPAAVEAALADDEPLTRSRVAALKHQNARSEASRPVTARASDRASLIEQANRCCDRLAALFDRMAKSESLPDEAAVQALRHRLARMAKG
jgi:ParB family chromosome partitioning protein